MKKLFICSIPMRGKGLKNLDYYTDKDEFLLNSAFPSIVLLNKYVNEDDRPEDISIVTIRDDCENSKINNERFLEELKDLSASKNISLEVSNEIVFPHNESQAKHLTIFKSLFEIYSAQAEGCKLYADMTYGTKVTSAELVASLSFSETKGIKTEDLCYGFFDHSIKDNTKGIFYSIRYVFDLINLINTTSRFMGAEKVEEIIKGLI